MQQWHGSSSVQSQGSQVQSGFKHSSLLQSMPTMILSYRLPCPLYFLYERLLALLIEDVFIIL